MGEKFSDVKTMNETFVGNYTIFKKGYYVDQLLAFTNVFKRSQVMVISSVGMYKDTSGMMENIRKFINVEEDDSFLGQLPHGTRPFACRCLSLSLLHCLIFKRYKCNIRRPLMEIRQVGDSGLHNIACSSA